MIVNNKSPHPPQHEGDSMLALVRDLLEMPSSQVSLERSARRLRLRFKIADSETGRVVRRSLELPYDDKIIAPLADVIQTHRHARRVSRHSPAARTERKIQ